MPLDTALLLDVAVPHDLTVRAAILIAALGLDTLVGDPPWLWGKVPHPVVLFGRAIAGADKLLNRPRLAGIRLTGKIRKILGVLAILLLVSAAAIIGGGLAAAASAGEMLISVSVELALVTILLAGRSLADHAKAVATALKNAPLKEARSAVARMVSRNPEALDRSAIARAAIESTAENFSDGVVAPALFYLVFGLPGIFAYKMVNTADSMVGYRSAQYSAYGWGTAQLDDLVNLAPARLTGLLIALSGPKKAWSSIAVMLRDAPHHRSPNAGWPEAAIASQIGCTLSGPRRYGSRIRKDRVVNQGARWEVESADIAHAVALIWRANLVFILLVVAVALIKYHPLHRLGL